MSENEETDTRSTRDILRAIDAKIPDTDSMAHVYVQNVNMPFSAMVGLVIKFWLATAVAALLLFVLGFFVSAIAGGSLLALFGRR